MGGRALRAPRRQGRLRGPLLLGLPPARSTGSRHKPHGLGRVRRLRRPGRGGAGHCGRVGGVLLRPGLGQGTALAPTVSPLLALLLGAASSSYLAYRWTTSRSSRKVLVSYCGSREALGQRGATTSSASGPPPDARGVFSSGGGTKTTDACEAPSSQTGTFRRPRVPRPEGPHFVGRAPRE